MPKSFRVRTEIGKEKNLTFELKQDFDLLEILSLSLTQQDVYSRMCSDFGVVVGRVISNGGFGIPNAKVSIFVPLDSEDATNPIIKQLYPYTQPYDKDEQGKRYNLLSSEENFDCHVPVGTFPKLRNVLSNQDVRYVYDKYYKFTAKTNDSGDFMIYGVPLGEQSLIMNVDLSDIETHFGLLKRTAKKDKVELFRVTSGNKKQQNAMTLLKKAIYNIKQKNYIKDKRSCAKCEFYRTEHCP